MPRAESHHRALRWAAGVMALALAALVATTATSASRRGATVELLGELERQGRFQNLDYVPKVSRTGAIGPGYSEGSMPYGISPSANICDHVYCPQEGDSVERNPRTVPTSPYAVTWTGYNWETFNDDVNVYEPSPCLAKHLAAPLGSAVEPCNGW
ncbi:hypothetical protein T484DRAFT_1951017 [Baffinella frigidus]|nr:hypothetical protein T484DRAFT_1951017 [Cryptophyta sp. CCMP2293]